MWKWWVLAGWPWHSQGAIPIVRPGTSVPLDHSALPKAQPQERRRACGRSLARLLEDAATSQSSRFKLLRQGERKCSRRGVVHMPSLTAQLRGALGAELGPPFLHGSSRAAGGGRGAALREHKLPKGARIHSGQLCFQASWKEPLTPGRAVPDDLHLPLLLFLLSGISFRVENAFPQSVQVPADEGEAVRCK